MREDSLDTLNRFEIPYTCKGYRKDENYKLLECLFNFGESYLSEGYTARYYGQSGEARAYIWNRMALVSAIIGYLKQENSQFYHFVGPVMSCLDKKDVENNPLQLPYHSFAYFQNKKEYRKRFHTYFSRTRCYHHDIMMVIYDKDDKDGIPVDFVLILEKFHDVFESNNPGFMRHKFVTSLKKEGRFDEDLLTKHDVDEETKGDLVINLLKNFNTKINFYEEITNFNNITKLTDRNIQKLAKIFPLDFEYIIDTDIKKYINEEKIEATNLNIDDCLNIYDNEIERQKGVAVG